MGIRKIARNRTLIVVVQGLFLLVLLSLVFSMIVKLSLTLITITDDILPQAEKTAQREAFEAAKLEAAQTDAHSLKLLGTGTYVALTLTFLLIALTNPEKRKLYLLRYGIIALLFTACVCVFLFAEQASAYTPVAILHATALSVDHIFSIVHRHKIRNVIPRVAALLLLSLTMLLALLIGEAGLLFLLMLTVPRIFYYIGRISFSQVKLRVLRRIVRKTYAAEILFGMLLLIIAFSIVLPIFESGMPTFFDALWYCFAIITTIGFGDITATTIPGRIISVILGIYGIISVALVTSIIVNFYNETKNSAAPDEDDPSEKP